MFVPVEVCFLAWKLLHCWKLSKVQLFCKTFASVQTRWVKPLYSVFTYQVRLFRRGRHLQVKTLWMMNTDRCQIMTLVSLKSSFLWLRLPVTEICWNHRLYLKMDEIWLTARSLLCRFWLQMTSRARISKILWLHSRTVGGSGDPSAIFIYVNDWSYKYMWITHQENFHFSTKSC